MNKPFGLCIIVLLFLCNKGYTQADGFYTYESDEYNFSFTCPKNWAFVEETNFLGGDGLKGYFISKDPTEARIYNECYEGKIFYLEVFNQPLEHTLLNKGYTKKDRRFHPRSGFMDNQSIPAEDVKGIGWTGIHHINDCKVSCKGDNTGAVVPGCEYLYFSDGSRTICFVTTGKALSEEVRRQMNASFTFLSDF